MTAVVERARAQRIPYDDGSGFAIDCRFTLDPSDKGDGWIWVGEDPVARRSSLDALIDALSEIRNLITKQEGEG